MGEEEKRRKGCWEKQTCVVGEARKQEVDSGGGGGGGGYMISKVGKE